VTHIYELVEAVHRRLPEYAQCGHEQAVTYACEDVVIEVLGSRTMTFAELTEWLQDVCEHEDIDMPVLVSIANRGQVAGSVDLGGNVICLRGSDPTVAVALHELAHVITQAETHDQSFRDGLVGLWRRHLSIEHAALLHQLYHHNGLLAGKWFTGT
jgi:hypothetical protein